MKTAPEISELRRHFELLPDGRLRRLLAANHRAPAGSIAGTLNKAGYVAVTAMGYRTYAHRIVWAMTHGHWPDGHVDHINHDTTDNRPENLRLASPKQNQHNRVAAKNNRLGVKGVTARYLRRSGRYNYVAQLSRGDGRSGYIGTFDSVEEAVAAYEQAAKRMHGEFYYSRELSDDQERVSGGGVFAEVAAT